MSTVYAWGEEDDNRYEEGVGLSAEEAIKRFLEYKRTVDKISEKAVKDYKSKLTNIFVPAEAKGTPLSKWGPRRMAEHVAMRRGQECSDHTVRDDSVVAKNFMTWLYKQKYFKIDLLERWDNPAITELKTDCAAATKADLDAFLRANNDFWDASRRHTSRFVHAKGREFYRTRDQLGILIIADTGVRPIELLRIKLNSIKADDFGTYIELASTQTKTGTARKLYLSPDTVKYALEPYLAIRANLRYKSGKDAGYLITAEKENERGEQDLDPDTWGKAIGRKIDFAKECGYMAADRHITPYSFKRYALETIDRVSVRASMAIAGHSTKGGLAVHARYNKGVGASDLASMDRAQEEASVRIAHELAGTVSGLKHLRK